MVVRNASGGGGEKADLREIFLRMEPGIRVSRSVRAEWLLEHMNCAVTAPKQKGGDCLSLFGMIPGTAKLAKEERPRIGPNTAVTFLADCYRVVFVLDLSPSSFVIDDLGCVLYSRLIQNLVKCLRCLVSKASIPGTQCEFRPRICVSVCAFSPFPCFPAENVLLHGVLLTPETIDPLIGQLLDRLKQYIDRLVLFTQPHMREWSSERRRNRRAGTTGATPEEIMAPPPTLQAILAKQTGGSTDRGFIQSDWALIFMLRLGLMGVQMMGQTGKSLANIVLITDGVCGVFDQQAMQGALGQLRLNAVACSFVQLRSASLRGPVLGHVGFPELFSFIATATFGAFLLESDLDGPKGPDGLNPVQRALLTWSFRKGLPATTGGGWTAGTCRGGGKSPSPQMGEQAAPLRTNHIRNKRYSRSYETSLCRLLAIRLREGFSIRQLDELQQGPIGGRGDEHGGGLLEQQPPSLLIRLCLAWRPQICIEYNICGQRTRGGGGARNTKLHVDVFVEAQLHSAMANLLGDRQDPSSLRSALISLNEGDALLMHLNSFNSETHYWDLPKEVDRSVALFEYKRATQRLAMTERYEALRNSKFISYWQPLSNIDEGFWQKWMHTHAVRLILAHDQPLPERIFTAQSKGRFQQCTAEMAFNELHNHLKRWASFALVRDQTYVCLIHEDQHNNESRAKKSSGLKAPDQFCLIRTSLDIPCVLVRLCFPPGVTGQTRDEVLAQFTDSLGKLRIVREHQFVLLNGSMVPEYGSGGNLADGTIGSSSTCLMSKTMQTPSLCLVQKPFERVLIRYKAVPRDLHRIVRLEWTESVAEKREMILHNAISKFLCCKRQVWRMRGIFLKNSVPALSAIEFILQTLLRLRLHQGFKLAWNKNGIVNLIRQVPPQNMRSDGHQPILEQCILFGPTLVDGGQHHQNGIDTTTAGIRPRKSSLCGDEEGGGGSDKFGTLESSVAAKVSPHGTTGSFWPQIITEVWSEPTKQSANGDGTDGVDASRHALLAENALLIRTIFTFDQLMALCNSRLWAEKPFVLDTQKGGAIEEGEAGGEGDGTNPAVQFLDGAFDLGALLENATQREMMLLPAMGYAESDPHSLSRLSFLLKGLQAELTEFCDACLDCSDDHFFGDIVRELESCLGPQQHHWEEDEMAAEEEDGAEGEREGEERAIEAELEEVWRRNLPPLREPPAERLTLPARPPPASSPPSPLPLGRHFSTGQHLYHHPPPPNHHYQNTAQQQKYYGKEPSSSIPNSPTPKNIVGLKTTFVLPPPVERGEVGGSRNQFSESADGQQKQQMVMRKGGGGGEQSSTAFLGGCSTAAQQQAALLFSASQRSTSVPLLWAGPAGGQVSPMKGKNGILRQQTSIVNVGTGGQMTAKKKFGQKRASISGQQRGMMLGIEEPKKKLSAPSSSSYQQQGHHHHPKASPRDSTQQKCAQQQPPRTLRVYAKRLSDWRLVVFVLAKDARVCRRLMPGTVPNTFPVMAYFCDKPRMAQHFVENMADGRLRPSEPWIVENFGAKSQLSPLAHLQQQIERRQSVGEGRAALVPAELDAFYLVGCHAAANLGMPPQMADTDAAAELAAHYAAPFDLVDHCEAVFEEFLFTKAFIGTVYACLGQELFVPVSVLSEALDYRCEHTNIEIGPINDILRDTCSHLVVPMERGAKRKEAEMEDGMIRPRKRRRPLSASSISSSSQPSNSSSSFESVSPSKRSRRHGGASSSMGRSSGEETLVMEDNGNGEGKSTGVEDCRDQLDDFRAAFEQLLRRHNFHRIPGLSNYFFYWPQPQEHSISSFNLPGLEDYIQITLPTEFSPPQSAAPFGEHKMSGAFSRHSSARNTGKEQKNGGRARKVSASAESIGGGKRRCPTTSNMGRAEHAEEAELGSIQSRCSDSSSTSWEQREEEDEEADSEKSSLAGELICPEHWPLFIQFYVAIQTASGQHDSSPVEFIPNCLKQILERSSLLRIKNGTTANCFQLGQTKINIDMYVLTWPLPSHCPYGSQSDEESSSAEHGGGGQQMGEEERDKATELEELFEGSDGAEWLKARRRPTTGEEAARPLSGDEIFERKVEMLRQIPAEERRLLRRLQRNVQKMLKTEHVLITSRGFEGRRDFCTLLRVVQFIREEVDGRGGGGGGGNAVATTGPRMASTEQTVARFEWSTRELVFVAEPEDGLRRLAAKLDRLPVEYCRLGQLPVVGANAVVPFELDALVDSTKLLFYACGVENLDHFARTRHESIRQIGTSFKRMTTSGDENSMAETVKKQTRRKWGGGDEGIIHFGETSEEEEEEEEGGEVEDEQIGLIEEDEEDEEEGREDGGGGGGPFCNSSTTADDGTIAELTMPLNDSAGTLDDVLSQVVRDLTTREIGGKGMLPKGNLLERKQLMHDFWLIVQVERNGGGDGGEGGHAPLGVNVYFCQRTFLLHDQLFESACRLVDDQIRLVNQELLLEKMHQTEECDQLLLDHDSSWPKGGHHGQIGGGGGIGLDSVPQGSAATRSAQNVPGEAALSRHAAAKFAQNRPSSLLLENEQNAAVKYRTMAAAAIIGTTQHARENSLTFSDEDEQQHSEVTELARYKFRPGHFACDLVWHHWFPIHPRLQPSRVFGGSGNDIGFKALRLGLEGLAVRNRSNMYVYKEQNSNVVYMRLHCTEESVLANIPPGPGDGGSWEEEVRQNTPNSILLAVHGVRPPGEEISVQLRSVLQRRLNSRTLEEIQNALLKNAHIRLEWSDIRFIQRDPSRPSSVFFFTVPALAQRHLGSVKYYLGQQMLTFCISPKFREQSGAAHPGRSKYSGSSRFFSGGGTSLALSLAGTPTIEQQPQQQQPRETGPHCFVPYSIPGTPPNPANYVPTFYLVNKPPGEGKRDTGIACLEVKLIEWEGGKLVEQTEEGQLDADSHSLLYPGIPKTTTTTGGEGRWHGEGGGHPMSRCVQVENPFECNPVPGTCALFQFNMWQNGNVGVEELQGRLKMCVQQAVCDLVTEFGLLSNSLFESSPSPTRSKAGSFSVASTSLGFQQPPMAAAISTSDLPTVVDHHHQDGTTTIGSSAPIQSSPVKALTTTTIGQQQSDPTSGGPFVKSEGGTICHPQPSLRHPVTMPLLNRAAQQQQSMGGGIAGGGHPHRSLQLPVQFLNIQPAVPPPPPSQKVLFHQESTGEYLRADFMAAADDWFSHVINETKGSPEMSHSVRKFQFRLDCDSSARKIIQVVNERLKVLLKTERVVICRSHGAAPLPEPSPPTRKRLQTLRSFTSLLDPIEKDLGRVVSSNAEAEPLEMALLAFNEQLGQQNCCLLRVGGGSQQPPPQAQSGAQDASGQNANMAKLGDQSSLSKFLPCLRPFIPRQRLLYVPIRGETVSLYIYNYTNEVVAKAREIVERTILWHNARSRLLREIGLHKMGITHLSTVKGGGADARYNSYLLLTWMDPETLINNDYPVDSLTTPDFSNIPRIYARLLLKLYRFADPAFVAKHISICPFDDQTQQMLALREDVRSMLNDHRLYMEVHQDLIERREFGMSEEMLGRLVSHCHQVHFVQTPLLLFPSWRRKVAAIRVGSADLGGSAPCRKHSFQSVHLIQQAANGKAKGKNNQFPVPSTGGTGSPSQRHSLVGNLTLEEEPCSGRIQQMLVDDYCAYLRTIGLTTLHIEKVPEAPAHLFTPLDHRHPSGVAGQGSGVNPVAAASSSPEEWLYCAQPGGIIFVQLAFMAPYFCLRVLQWNAQPQLDEHFRPNQQPRRTDDDATRLDQQHSLRLLEHQKNGLVRRCHLHSFVYDFHLRMVARYLVGDRHVLFNPGYNTNAFLVDFLQYYGCRPPNARNCVYEETVNCGDLQVGQAAIWEHFLNNEQHFGWKVVRLKSGDGAPDEFMLVAKERRRAFGLDYELVRVVINPSGTTRGGAAHHQTMAMANNREQQRQIALRLYVLLVTEMTAPFELNNNNAAATAPSSSSPHATSAATLPESKSAADLLQQHQQCATGPQKSFAPDGGEFTQIFAPNAFGRFEQQMEMPQLSPCSTLVEQKEAAGDGTTELESFGEEEEEEEAGDEGRVGETRVVDREEEDGNEGEEGSLFPALVPPPSVHHRQQSASSITSQQSLGRRAILPSQLAQPGYCYECVIAAAAELNQAGEGGGGREAVGKGGEDAGRLAAVGSRQRFSSGGILLSGPGRRSVAARMSLPPSSRTSTNSSSSSAAQHRATTGRQQRLYRQRSDSSQLSANSSVNSPTKKEMGTATLTPTNSLKGLSEWRANQKQSAGGGGGADECDWTLYEEPSMGGRGSGGGGGHKLAIQRNPPRRHRKGQAALGGGTLGSGSGLGETIGREKGAIVPPEQVTYLHYLSGHQRRLQHLLEEEVRANRLAQFVVEADRFCYVDTLWKRLLASRPFQMPSQRAPPSLFLSSTSSKGDMFSEVTISSSSALFGGRQSIGAAADMGSLDFEALLRVIGVEPAAEKEPKLAELLARVNWQRLCRFLVQFYEGAKRCRYFENSPFSYLVITNPQFLDSGAMFRHNSSTESVDLFLLFKQTGRKFESDPGSFASNSMHKLLEEVLSCLCSFLWSNLLQNAPNLA